MLASSTQLQFSSYPESFWAGSAYNSITSGRYTNLTGNYRYNVNERIFFSADTLAYLSVRTTRNMDTDEKLPIETTLWIFRGDFIILDGIFKGGRFRETVKVATPQTYDSGISNAVYKLSRYKEDIEFGQWIVDPESNDVSAKVSDFYQSSFINKTNVVGGREPKLTHYTPALNGEFFQGLTYVKTPTWDDFYLEAVKVGFPPNALYRDFPYIGNADNYTSPDISKDILLGLGFSDLTPVEYPLESRFYTHPNLEEMGFRLESGATNVREGETLAVKLLFQPIPINAPSKQLWWRIEEVFDGTQIRSESEFEFTQLFSGSIRTNSEGAEVIFINPRSDKVSEMDETYTLAIYDSASFTNSLASFSFNVIDKGAAGASDANGVSSINAVIGVSKLIASNGPDRFRFGDKDSFGVPGADTITNFDSTNDRILFSRVALPGARNSSLKSARSPKAFKKALKSNSTFVYNQRSGELFFNANGKKSGFGEGGLVAVMEGAPQLFATNIEVF